MLEIWEGLRSKADKDNDGQVSKQTTHTFFFFQNIQHYSVLLKFFDQTIRYVIKEEEDVTKEEQIFKVELQNKTNHLLHMSLQAIEKKYRRMLAIVTPVNFIVFSKF